MNMATLAKALTAVAVFMASSTSATADTLEIPGTGDGMVILRELAKSFEAAHPEHRIIVPDSIGSSGGIRAAGRDEALLARAARGLKADEAEFGLTDQPIFSFPVTFFTNPDVDVADVSAEQIVAIYRGEITDWSALGGRPGLIRVVRREDGDSSLKNLRETFPGFADLQLLERSKTTTTTQETMEAVVQNSGAIGFGPMSDAMSAGLHVLTIGGIDPLSRDYPTFTTVRLVYKDANRTGLVAAFIDHVLSAEGDEVLKGSAAIPLK